MVGKDELQEVLDFFGVLNVLRLASVNWQFLRTYLRHRGRDVVVGHLASLIVNKDTSGHRWKLTIRRDKLSLLEVPEEFHVPPPDDIKSVDHLQIVLGKTGCFSEVIIIILMKFTQ